MILLGGGNGAGMINTRGNEAGMINVPEDMREMCITGIWR